VIANFRLPIADLKLKNKIRNVFSSNLTCLKIANRQSSIGNHQSAIGNAFTLVELLIVISIIAILAAMLLPALKAAKNKATSMVCIGQMKQLVLANQMYISDYNEYPATLKPPYMWYETLNPYLGNKLTVWGCPANEEAPLLNTPYNYANPTASNTLFKQVASVGCNGWAFLGLDNSTPAKLLIYRTNLFKEPSKLVYCADGRKGKEVSSTGMNNNTMLEMRPTDPVAPFQTPGWYGYYVRHTKIINIGFLDGHAEGIYYNEFLSWCGTTVTTNRTIRFVGFW
ncbi:MAG: type II secretion system protein, partial [Desulfuromonadales bacterium]